MTNIPSFGFPSKIFEAEGNVGNILQPTFKFEGWPVKLHKKLKENRNVMKVNEGQNILFLNWTKSLGKAMIMKI